MSSQFPMKSQSVQWPRAFPFHRFGPRRISGGITKYEQRSEEETSPVLAGSHARRADLPSSRRLPVFPQARFALSQP
jgi:hypothetical protein